MTALTAHLFESAGIGAGVGGNLGTAVFDIKRAANAPYVLELSSYQLDLCQTTRFQVAALLNLSADHLDRHGGLQGYIQAKLRIFQRQTLSDFAFISIDDDHCRSVASALERSGQYNVIKVSALTPFQAAFRLLMAFYVLTTRKRHYWTLSHCPAHSQDGTIGKTPPLLPEWPGPWACGVIKLSPD